LTEIRLVQRLQPPASATPPRIRKPSTQSHKGLSSGAAAGIGVGIGVMAIILVAIIGFVLIRRRKARTVKAQPMPYEPASPAELHSKYVQEYRPVRELDVPPAELSEMTNGWEGRAELPGHH
jgi:hypothetical protein